MNIGKPIKVVENEPDPIRAPIFVPPIKIPVPVPVKRHDKEKDER